MRVGIGFDVHAVSPDRPMVIGGVEVPSDMGLMGHSDGDVASHAIIDAVLGAAALGDLGVHFPPTDPEMRDISSLELLRRTAVLLQSQGWGIINVDVTIVAEYPKLGPYLSTMCQRVAGSLGLTVRQVSIKATTTDGLGYAGRGEGVGAYAVASIYEVGP